MRSICTLHFGHIHVLRKSGNRNQSAMLTTTKLTGISKEFLTYCTGCFESRVDDSNTGTSVVPAKRAKIVLSFLFK